MNTNIFNEREQKLPRTTVYVSSIIAGIFMAFIFGWLFLIPAIVGILLIYGLIQYKKDIKNRITLFIKPSAAMRAIARKEENLKKEKERIIYEQIRL
jgi:hypothetical protein